MKTPNRYKILIIAPTAYPLGGVAVWLDYLLSGLSARGVDITFGAVNGEFHDSSDYLKQYPFSKTVIIDNPSLTHYGRLKSIKRAVKKCNPDILVSVNIPDVYGAARELKSTTHPELKVVSTIHGLVENLFSDLEKYYDCIDYVIVTNKLTQLMVEQLTSFETDSILYAPYGVIEHSPKRRHDFSKPVRLLYCGRIDNEQKRCADIVQIIRELENRDIDYQLNLVGDGPYKTQLLSDLSTFVSEPRTHDFGVLPAKDLASKVYAKSDILLLTSSWETGPIVIWEAMASGVAVVTSRYNGLNAEGALFDQHNCGVFDVGDTFNAVDKIEQMCEPEVASNITANSYQLIEERYSRNVSLDRWQFVFDQIFEMQGIKKNNFMVTRYTKNGLLERIFGLRIADSLRILLNKPAFSDSASCEWPHTHSTVSEEYCNKFTKTLNALNRSARIEK